LFDFVYCLFACIVLVLIFLMKIRHIILCLNVIYSIHLPNKLLFLFLLTFWNLNRSLILTTSDNIPMTTAHLSDSRDLNFIGNENAMAKWYLGHHIYVSNNREPCRTQIVSWGYYHVTQFTLSVFTGILY